MRAAEVAYSAREAAALRDLAIKVVADPSSHPDHVSAAKARLAPTTTGALDPSRLSPLELETHLSLLQKARGMPHTPIDVVARRYLGDACASCGRTMVVHAPYRDAAPVVVAHRPASDEPAPFDDDN